jgi:hypothetical protein
MHLVRCALISAVFLVMGVTFGQAQTLLRAVRSIRR